mmetsp:Transcript_7709/g.18924  ORF Transcript_7709/g.18924 Transcript_7709/m.18924 type:complete len:114 (-) Transcript_7709:849-1190(-)
MAATVCLPTKKKSYHVVERVVRIGEIYYSQDAISTPFRDWTSLQETLDALTSGDLGLSDIPQITVRKYGERYYTQNNRCLAMLEEFKESPVPHTIPRPQQGLHPRLSLDGVHD